MSRLDHAQTEAVNHRDGPCIVLAGPGAGKTSVLTQRAARLVASGVPAERVLLLTFSRAAAREMMHRAAQIEPRCEALSGGTFHATATKIVNRNSHVFGSDRPFTVLDPEDCTALIKKIMDRMRTGDVNWPTPRLVAKIISFADNTRGTIEESVKRIAPAHADSLPLFEAVRDAFVEKKISSSLLSYDDALIYWAALLADPTIGPMICSQWDHVLVDEYQDTNALQLDIVNSLCGERRNVMIVGDPSQAIYGFRGSAPKTMGMFRKRFADSRIVKLEANYRSTNEIVALVNAVDDAIATGFDRQLTSPNPPSGKRPILLESVDDVAQAGEIAKSILQHKENGGEISDVAILVRSMSFARRIEVELTSRRIPYKVVGGLRIDEAAHAKDLLSIARLATNHRHEPAWLRLLSRHRKIGDVAAAQIAEKIIALDDPMQAPALLEEEAIRRNADFDRLPDAIRAAIGPYPAPDAALASVVSLMEPFWSGLKEWKDDWADRRRDLDSIVLLAAEHRDLDTFLTTITLDYSVDRKKQSDAEREEEKPVTISTVHGAKGLEWPIVHLPSFQRGHIPSAYAEDQDEELRILYVALSRARETLVIHRPAFDAKGGYASPSDFERIVRPYCEVVRATRTAAEGAPVQTSARIDMRAQLLRPR